MTSRVIESITGRPFNDFMTETVFAQLRMGPTTYVLSFGQNRVARGHIYLLGFAIPMPFGPVRQPNTANLRCSTASDFGKFITELMTPRFIDKKLVDEVLTDQVHEYVDKEPVTWGLGIGSFPTSKETCFGQRGSSSDFKSYLVGCPASKMGVVILTNSARDRIVARTIAAKALGE